jgi:hypothetical protein
MKPRFSVAAHVNVGCKDNLHSLSRKINPCDIHPLIVSSHKLWLTALCFFLLLAPAASGTSIAIMVTGDRILIAADGAGATIAAGSIYRFEPYCKIRNQGSVFYTASGYYEVPEVSRMPQVSAT